MSACLAADCVLAPGHAGPHSDDGAPVHGGVTDPAATSGGPPLLECCACCGRLAGCDCALLHLPAYRAIIASCPRCGSHLEPDGFTGFWCAGCREGISAREAIQDDETDYERD